jgi:galactose-1-phosphate uridylyltransferase
MNSPVMDDGAGNLQKKMDDTTITVTDNVSNKPVSLATQAPTDNVTDKTKKGLCEFCSAEFDKKVSWKRFCCDDCRIKAWEQKNGKQWKGKKVA